MIELSIRLCQCCNRLLRMTNMKIGGKDVCTPRMSKKINNHAHGRYQHWDTVNNKLLFSEGSVGF